MLNTTFEVFLKKFTDKLLVIITNGEKFGNIISASYQKLDRETEVSDIMGFSNDVDEFDDEEFNEEQDHKEEFSGCLLLGDRS